MSAARMAASSFMAIWKEPSPHTTMSLAVGTGHLGPHSGREGVAHGAQAAAGEQASVLLGEIFAGEDLVLAHIHADDGIVVQPGSQPAEDCAREDRARPAGEDAVQLPPSGSPAAFPARPPSRWPPRPGPGSAGG